MRRIMTQIGSAPVSAVGFGCGSLGSRVSARDGRAALARAFDAGVTWFDVAPSYGHGEAEGVLAPFLASRRGEVNVCTKVGVAARTAAWKTAVRPAARFVIRHAPALRQFVRLAAPTERLPLTSEAIRASLDGSLRRLRVERVDLLMLHDVSPEEAAAPAVHEALLQAIASGKAAAVGIAAPAAACRQAAAFPEVFSVLQFPSNPLAPNIQQNWAQVWRDEGRLLITFGALDAQRTLPLLIDLLHRDPGARALFADAGYDGAPKLAAAAFLTDYALAANPLGICLFSAMAPTHLRALIKRSSRAPDACALRLGAYLPAFLTDQSSCSYAA
ncbi:aldo/keto reductase [Hansschlegelia quercus]|uniref:Aldo/keto reductase n=1 Tax=Hansschlegelia quercus TaxID=2528245 RepID=A0A4Q9GJP5_9HYPH|nr:aldo/keto reductase [Hansschlegelia quercus]TBN54549.1 aldo/keto reductase [Hansschlegelia quercus]